MVCVKWSQFSRSCFGWNGKALHARQHMIAGIMVSVRHANDIKSIISVDIK